MDYARLEFGGGGRGIYILSCNEWTEALCMFTPMQWKRIIPGLVQHVVGMVTEMVQPRVTAIDGSHRKGLGTFTVRWNAPII